MSNSSTVWQKLGALIGNIQTVVISTLTSITGGSATAYNTFLAVPNTSIGVTPLTNTKKVLLICTMANYCGAVPVYRIKCNGTVIFTATSPSNRKSVSFSSGHTAGTPL